MVLTVSFVLSPVIGLSCHRHRRDAKHRRQLDASVEASRPHDFAVREPSVIRLVTLPRPSHPAPTFVTIREAPLFEGTGRQPFIAVSTGSRSEIFFVGELDSDSAK